MKNLLAAGAVVVMVGVVAALLWFNPFSSSSNPFQVSSDAATWNTSSTGNPPVRVIPEGYVEYVNEEYRFSFYHPPELQIEEFDEGEGAVTIRFQDPSTKAGFQVFITSYAEQEITPERFALDVPSGVIKEPTDVLIDGYRGTMFLSQHTLLGETREVWFMRGGNLFEVTTYKQLDPWLAQIMSTWKFIPQGAQQ